MKGDWREEAEDHTSAAHRRESSDAMFRQRICRQGCRGEEGKEEATGVEVGGPGSNGRYRSCSTRRLWPSLVS